MMAARVISAGVILGVVVSVPAFAAIETSHVESDEALLVLLPEENVAFVAEGRIGDLSGDATFELDLGRSTASPDTTSQHAWQNGVSEAFSLSYDKILNTAHFVLGDDALSYSPALLFMEIFIRTQAVGENTAISVHDLVLNGESVQDSSSAAGADGLDILRVTGPTLLDGFTLTGAVTLSWSGAPPTQSQLAFQILVGSPDSQVATQKKSWGQLKERFRPYRTAL